MKRVFSSHNLVLVHHSQNLLEAEGIETAVRNQMLSSAWANCRRPNARRRSGS